MKEKVESVKAYLFALFLGLGALLVVSGTASATGGPLDSLVSIADVSTLQTIQLSMGTIYVTMALVSVGISFLIILLKRGKRAA